jgi:tRNA (cytidine/uridine-2'-O-)-methyltransferase
MFHVVLYQPEIPPNTGNIIRLCANSGTSLHLIRPLGFDFDDKRLRRAGLDYHEFASVKQFDSIEEFVSEIKPHRLLACTTKAQHHYSEICFEAGDAIVMGPETRGLPMAFIESLPPQQRLRIPMMADSRSLNLSNATAIILYEAWRQHGFGNMR